MNWSQEIAHAREAAKEYARNLAGRVVMWTTLSSSSASGDEDGAQGWPTEEDEPQDQLRCRRTESWGVRGRPPAGVLAAIVRPLAGAAANVIVGIATTRYGRQNLDVGETQIYGAKADAELFLKKDGGVELRSTAPQDVRLNDGNARAAGQGDEVDLFTIEVVAGAGGAITAIKITPATGGGLVTLNATTPGPFTLSRAGQINMLSTRRVRL